jgi:hypothetical protein
MIYPDEEDYEPDDAIHSDEPDERGNEPEASNVVGLSAP